MDVSLIEKNVRSFYQKHNPGKLGEVPAIMAKRKGKEGELLKNLEQKYGVLQEAVEEEDLC